MISSLRLIPKVIPVEFGHGINTEANVHGLKQASCSSKTHLPVFLCGDALAGLTRLKEHGGYREVLE